MSKPLLIYDGECGFCSASARWAKRHLGERAGIVPWQEVNLAELGLTSGQAAAAAWWVDERGRLYRGHAAVGRALLRMGGGWALASGLLLMPPFSWAAKAGYAAISHNRHRLPGGPPSCSR